MKKFLNKQTNKQNGISAETAECQLQVSGDGIGEVRVVDDIHVRKVVVAFDSLWTYRWQHRNPT